MAQLMLFSASSFGLPAPSGQYLPSDQQLHPSCHLQNPQLPSGLTLQMTSQGNGNILLQFVANSHFSEHSPEHRLIGGGRNLLKS